jgi:hypothetical protein
VDVGALRRAPGDLQRVAAAGDAQRLRLARALRGRRRVAGDDELGARLAVLLDERDDLAPLLAARGGREAQRAVLGRGAGRLPALGPRSTNVTFWPAIGLIR